MRIDLKPDKAAGRLFILGLCLLALGVQWVSAQPGGASVPAVEYHGSGTGSDQPLQGEMDLDVGAQGGRPGRALP